MLSEKREQFKKLEAIVGDFFSKFLTANQYSGLAILMALFFLKFIISGNLKVALIFLITTSFLDFVDGAVARKTNTASNKGAYLDTILDRYVEAIVLFSFLFLPLPKLLFPSYVWILFTLLGSFMTTYAKAAGKEKEILKTELKKGLIGRGERMILESLAILFGIFNFNWTLFCIIILAILSNITAFQRIYLVLNNENI
ncbi:MAG: CDP-alcohol phosphatidyltransferase family protein [Patescibacteria group bacterium]|nr:CDP-alcohol phosphatidyltransferase family protein [Patescibacteria group bacterium]MBU1877235.1 CDP-alcohol phosphatidyltransferase family protein [Patescibacteria group bacterium]